MPAPSSHQRGSAGRKPTLRRPAPRGPRTAPGATAGPHAGSHRADPHGRTTGHGPDAGAVADAPAGPLAKLWRRLEGEPGSDGTTGYYMILGSALALTLIGLMMVLSSSAVEAISRETSSYALFLKQGGWAVAGCVAMFLMSRLSIDRLKRLAWPAVILAAFLLILVFTPLGISVYGNRNWIGIGGFTAQPSEAAKLALAVWAAQVLATKGHLVTQTLHALIPVLVPGGLVIIGLVLLGRDLGTALILVLILVAALFLGGARLRLFGVAAAAAAAGALIMVAVSGNRMSRINAWLGLNCDTEPGACYQSQQGLYALASGGWWGLGLGQSRQKWNYIPEAENDFIFAIIGEELGLIGTFVIISLFGIMALAMYRVAARHDDRFVRVATGGIMAWLIGQSFVNIGMVTGLLPVIGVPLPFISYGGSALTFALMAVGVVLSFARQRPDPADAA
ncbi:MAG: putative lipid II flippase FtsW [Arthrobacter sp.]|uniref:putative lipid II flippase FtsW n=1 Tax=Arthrobacter sp. TaxID=1667 RepID=UPI0034886DB9